MDDIVEAFGVCGGSKRSSKNSCNNDAINKKNNHKNNIMII